MWWRVSPGDYWLLTSPDGRSEVGGSTVFRTRVLAFRALLWPYSSQSLSLEHDVTRLRECFYWGLRFPVVDHGSNPWDVETTASCFQDCSLRVTVFFCVCHLEKYPFTQNMDQGLTPAEGVNGAWQCTQGPSTHVPYGSHGAEWHGVRREWEIVLPP